MDVILSDMNKFRPDDSTDNSKEMEKRIIKELSSLKSNGVLTAEMFARLKPAGTGMPHLYGLPKIHKENCPLRPILSMCNSAQHKLAQWLVETLEPVRQHMSKYSLKDSFELVEKIG
jgi:hypothetical protein